jgi:large subunit ribosomal protein L24
MAKNWLKRGVMADVIAGEDSGKSGKVLHVDPVRGRAIVEGCHLVRKHMRKTQDNPQGGIVEKEAPIHVSNLRLHGAGGGKG